MIRYNLVKGRREDIQGLAGQMKNYAHDTDNIRRKLRGKISSYDQIGRRLNQISDRIEKNGRDLEQFGEKLKNIVHLYEQSEKRILGQAVSDSGITEPDEKGFSLDIGVSIGDFAVKFSFAGSMESMVAPWWMSVLDSSTLLSLAGDVGKDLGNPVLKRLGGLGTVLSVAQTIKNNCDEYEKEEISEGRVALETVGELAADWAIGVGMTAVAATLLPVGAPAVAVGAVAAVATWALDQASDLCFGKSASEAISDGIIDFGENVVQGIQSGKSVPEAVIDGVIDSGGKFVQGIQSGGEKVVQGMADWWGNLRNS